MVIVLAQWFVLFVPLAVAIRLVEAALSRTSFARMKTALKGELA